MKKKLVSLLFLICFSQVLKSQNMPINADQARQALLKNVKKVASVGTPGPILVFKETAFPVLLSPNGSKLPVMAAASLGNGKVVAFGHDGYVDVNEIRKFDTGTLLANSIRWASGQQNPNILTRDMQDFGNYLKEFGFTNIKNLDYESQITAQDLQNVSMIIVDPDKFVVDDQVNEIETVKNFIKSGKGGLFARLGWGWIQLNPEKSIKKDFKGNILLKEAGLAWVDGYLDQPHFEASPISPYLNYENAKNYVLNNDYKTANKSDFSQALGVFLDGIPLVGEKNFAIPTDFPLDVQKGTPTVSKNIEVDTKIPSWHSTGLYAAAGAKISIKIPENLQGNLKVRIGAHTDELFGIDNLETEGWKRMPKISMSFDLEKGNNEVFNPFGGLIYIDVPENLPSQMLTINISGAVEAPYFKLGKTSLADWKSKIRNYPAEYGEIEGEELTFTFESKYLRNLENPEEIAIFWDKIQAANRKLSDWKADRSHKMRVVFDRQISGGYMHSGYPVMALTGADYVDEQANVLNLKEVNKWGFVHELGHNHQDDAWTFDGTGEVTCNLFSLYALEKVMGVTGGQVFDNLKPEGLKNFWNEYLKTGKSFDKWKDEPFLALSMYMQMQSRYGWESFEKVFVAYNQLKDEDRPKNDEEKRDMWLKMYSKIVGENLSEFFQVWNVPTSENARQSLSNLPKADLKRLMGE